MSPPSATIDTDVPQTSEDSGLLQRIPSGTGLAVLRIVVGIIWLHEAQWKTPPSFSGLEFWLGQAVEFPTSSLWASLVENAILPNLVLFGWLTLLMEASLGAFLIVGLGTRFWAAVGIAQSIAITLSVISAPDEWSYAYYMLIAVHIALFTGAGGRALGIDGLLRDRWRAISETGSGATARMSDALWRMS